MKDKITCRICSKDAERKNNLNLLALVSSSTWECENCGVLFRDPLPDSELVKEYYSSRYFRHSDKIEHSLAKSQVKWIAKILKQSNLYNESISYVEFGAGRGWLVSEMTKICKNSLGYETDDVSVRWGRENLNINLQSGFITKNKKFIINHDKKIIFSFSHVLEHINDPMGILQYINNEYVDSLLYIEVPNCNYERSSMIFDVSSNSSMGQHFWSFTKDSLEKLLSNSGYDVISIEEFGSNRFYDNWLISLDVQNDVKNRIENLIDTPFSLKNYAVNTGIILIKCLVAGLRVMLNNLFFSSSYSRENMPVIRVLAKSNRSKNSIVDI